jgi:hypothetical protein
MDEISGDTCTEELCKDDVSNCEYCNNSFWDFAQDVNSLTEPEWEIEIKTIGEFYLFTYLLHQHFRELLTCRKYYFQVIPQKACLNTFKWGFRFNRLLWCNHHFVIIF